MSKPDDKSRPSQSARPPSLSQKLSLLTQSNVQPEEMHKKAVAVQEKDDEEVPFDERWLMSYADKMTLLCGCFIMLFAISTIDPIRLKQLQKSTEKSFGRPTGKEEEKAFDHQQVAIEAPKQEEIIGSLLKTNEDFKEQIVALRTENNTTKVEIQKITEKKEILEETIKKIQLENHEIKQLQSKTPTKIQEMVKTIKTLEQEKVQLNGLIETLEQNVMTKDNKIENLSRQLTSLEESNNKSNFLAFVMSWSNPKQDIDLYVTDPSGRTFDFKNRNYKDHPGFLVLDTRQGPGVEVWQSDRIVPGVYSFRYFFYNAYGNTDPCSIQGTLFTSKGQVSLPLVTLNPQSKVHIERFRIDEKGMASRL